MIIAAGRFAEKTRYDAGLKEGASWCAKNSMAALYERARCFERAAVLKGRAF
jgi:hypothetical protein